MHDSSPDSSAVISHFPDLFDAHSAVLIRVVNTYSYYQVCATFTYKTTGPVRPSLVLVVDAAEFQPQYIVLSTDPVRFHVLICVKLTLGSSCRCPRTRLLRTIRLYHSSCLKSTMCADPMSSVCAVQYIPVHCSYAR